MENKSKISSIFDSLFLKSRVSNILEKLEKLVDILSPSEKIFFGIFVTVFVVTAINMFWQLNKEYTIEVPSSGGSFTEGFSSSPRFINPTIAISDTDKDITKLIYSGLLKSKDGRYIGDLAERYSISDDGLTYEVKIKDGAYFHDNVKVTAEDVLFTISKITDPIIKSPRRSNWDGVIVEKINDSEIRFILRKPYAPFIESLTIGILPKHIWENVSSEEFPFSEINIKPVGSGPYKIDNVKIGSGGIPSSINLSAFKKYTGGKPYITNINLKFFKNQTEVIKAYADKSINSISDLDPSLATKIQKNQNLKNTELPRVFAVFFNQNQNQVFLNQEVREALNESLDKQKIVDEVLYGFGKPLYSPTVENDYNKNDSTSGEAEKIEVAKAKLLKAGWKPNTDGILEKKIKNDKITLSFSLSTTDTPELKRTAEILKDNWSRLGVNVEVKVFETGDLNQNVIKPRKYDALLFGEVVSRDGDLYPFWHSSQRNDPGLNVAMYTNISADKLLENIRSTSDEDEKKANLDKFVATIQKDVPAVFLFAPDFIYVKPESVKNITFGRISNPNERFANIKDWYIETDNVWKIFANK